MNYMFCTYFTTQRFSSIQFVWSFNIEYSSWSQLAFENVSFAKDSTKRCICLGWRMSAKIHDVNIQIVTKTMLYSSTQNICYTDGCILWLLLPKQIHISFCVDWMASTFVCAREERRDEKKKTQQKTKICVGVLKLCLVHQSNAPAIEVAVRGPFNVRRHQSRWLIFGIKSIKNQFQRIKPLKRRVNGFATNRIFVGSNET